MAKKEKRELTPEELEAKKVKKQRRSERWTKFWAVVLALVLVCGVCFGAKTMADKTRAAAEQTTEAADDNNNAAPVNNNTAPVNNNTAPADNSSTPADNSSTPADNSSTPADNSGNNEQQAPQASVAETINAAMAAAEGAGYTWTRTGALTSLDVPGKAILNPIIGAVSKGATVESVVGGFLGAKGTAESLTRGKGETPLNEEKTDTYYHWEQYKIIKSSVTDADLKNVKVEGNNYSFDLDACQNPEAGSAGFSRFTNDFVTLSMIQQEIAKQVGDKVTVSSMTATYGPMHVDMTIENGKVTALSYTYTASVDPLSLKAGISINGKGSMQVQASYSNFQY